MAFPCHFCSGILRPFVASYMFGVLSSPFPEVLRYLYLSGLPHFISRAFVLFPMAPSFSLVNNIFLFPLRWSRLLPVLPRQLVSTLSRPTDTTALHLITDVTLRYPRKVPYRLITAPLLAWLPLKTF